MIPKKNDATYKVIYWVGVFQGNKFNLTTANVITPYDFFRSEKKSLKKKVAIQFLISPGFMPYLISIKTKQKNWFRDM